MFASLWSDLCNVTNLELRFLILLHCMFQDSFLLIDTGEGEGEGREEGEAEERRDLHPLVHFPNANVGQGWGRWSQELHPGLLN